MMTTTVWAVAGSAAACPVIGGGGPGRGARPGRRRCGVALSCPDAEFAGACRAADPHPARASATAASSAADLTIGQRFTRSAV